MNQENLNNSFITSEISTLVILKNLNVLRCMVYTYKKGGNLEEKLEE